MTTKTSLEERVLKFNSLALPGQPLGMHMGTSYLVNDLWREVQRSADEVKRLTEEVDNLREAIKNRTVKP